MKKILILTISLIFILILATGCDNSQVDIFNDIIIERYPNKDNFNKFHMDKLIDDSTKIRYATVSTDDVEIIKEFLSYFKNLEVVKIDTTPKEVPFNEIYEVNFIEDDTYSKLKIQVLNDEYLRILNYIYIRKYNKEKNEISYDKISETEFLKIVDGKLDLDYFERIFSSLKE